MKQTRISVPGIIWGAALIIWMGVIYYFSAQTGESSSEMSGGIVRFVVHLLWKDYDQLSLLEQARRLNSLTFVIRKCAHFTEYGILAFLASGFLSTWNWKGTYKLQIRIGGAWCFALLYAVSDELHQMFSEGRSPQVFDVWVDSCGAAAGIGAFFLGIWLIRKYKAAKSRPVSCVQQ